MTTEQTNTASEPRRDASRLSDRLGLLIDREMERARTIAYGPNSADDETREGDFGTWGDWRELVLRVAAAAVAAERERCAGIVRNAAAHHGLCCSDCEALADLVAGLGA